MKKISFNCLAISVIFVMLLPFTVFGDTANANNALLFVNVSQLDEESVGSNSVVNVGAYNINGNNYFKLRDIAYLLHRQDLGFHVGWNDKENLIEINTKKGYARAGGELLLNKEDKKVETAPIRITLKINDIPAILTAYNIDGNYYFQLRELGSLLDFQVNWLESEQAIQILKK